MAQPSAAAATARNEMDEALLEPIAFKSLRKVENRYTFTITPIHVSYVNTLRRIILTGVESVAFRSDMISTGSKAGTTSDVTVILNDTPMTNEMLADRFGLLPINVTEPLAWKKENYVFTLDVEGTSDKAKYVTANDIKITLQADDGKEERVINTSELFPPHPITGQTSLLAMLQPNKDHQRIHITAQASLGTGREHARFSTVSQCSYEYSLDNDEERIEGMFTKWLLDAKKVSALSKDDAVYDKFKREFNTMQIKRCYLVNAKQQPYSFDFTVESVGPLSVEYIVKRACEVGENMCTKYSNVDTGDLPGDISISPADSRIIGFDFLIRNHDHTLGNLLQTWLVENHIEGNTEPKIGYAGYSVPHPLRDEMILRIGVLDGKEETARKALAAAAKGCAALFKELRMAWESAIGAPRVRRSAATTNKLRASMNEPSELAATSPSLTFRKLDE
jgi:DNA-directed RNA polymerase subunit L/DNA-directed RNA polymerase alpha subunit